jgi:hypothetical protein
MTVFAGCSSIGPTSVPGDQFNYNSAIAQSSQEQLLLNLVRLRYSEAPVFVRVNSVISQYSRTVSTDAGVGVNTGGAGENAASVGGRVTWSDRPTITYTPISGQEFSKNLLTPIPPVSLFKLMLSGWPAELVLETTTWSINEINNDLARPSRRREASPEFIEFFGVWRRLLEAGVVGFREQPDSAGSDIMLFFQSGRPIEEVEEDIRRFSELLGIDPDVSEFSITYGVVPQEPDDIAVLSGSIWEIMLDLAWRFEVPPEHVANGMTSDMFAPQQPTDLASIRLGFSEEMPTGAFVAVPLHGYWFYIDNEDRQSKRVFSFLQLLLTLAEKSEPGVSPVITISS